MPNQPLPDLFGSTLGSITPAREDGPRLWVRRLVIWSERGTIVRDIPLRPGLNIIWSPDADADGGNMGHGGGKTSLCRLLRYCLGENSFGTVEQRQLIANAMPHAHVGAEVMLDGEQWVVVRPIGNPRGRHLAQKGGVLDKAFSEDMPNPTMGPLRKAIADAIMPDATQYMPGTSSADEAWEAALAWISRDQECRLLDILDWRAAETQSQSPTRDMSKADRRNIVRLLLNALQPEEIEATRQAQGHRRTADEALKKKERLEWVRENSGRDLSEIFGGAPEDTGSPKFWTENAGAAAKAEQSKIDPDAGQKLKAARDAVEKKRAEIITAEKRLAAIDGELGGLEGSLRLLGNQLPKAQLRLQDASDPKCDACGQPITTLAQAFIEERKAEYDELVVQQSDAQDRKKLLLSEEGRLNYQVAAGNQKLVRRSASLTSFETEIQQSEQRLASARGYVTMTSQYRDLALEIGKLDKAAKAAEIAEGKARHKVDEIRRKSQNVVGDLSAHFDAIIRYLIPDGAQGQVVLDKDGIRPSISLHGNLTTAAVDSLKVVAFDLAALLLAVEGKAQLPGFWLHDSPREADLGLHIYHRLFALARHLEGASHLPAFQYIVTTTTAPPEEMQSSPFLSLVLKNSPGEDRLFKVDL